MRVLSGRITGICVFTRNTRIRTCVLVRPKADPPSGHARLGEHGERPDLEAGYPTQSILDAIEGGVHGQGQRQRHVMSVGVPRNRADHLLTGILLQALQVPLQLPPLNGRSRRSLRKRQRKIPQTRRHGIGGLYVLRTHNLQKVGDGLLTGEHAHIHALPPLLLPPVPTPARGYHPQPNATRNQIRQILRVFDVVENNESVTGIRGLQVVEASSNQLILGRIVSRIYTQSVG